MANYRKLTHYILLAAIIILFSMVPGGPVENRSFSNVLPSIVLGFNIYLVALTILAISSVYFMHRGHKWAYQAAGFVGLNYAIIFALDLFKIFPVSYDAMSPLLFVLEIAGVLFGFILLILSYLSLTRTRANDWASSSEPLGKPALLLAGLMIITGVFIVVFATRAALT